MSTPSPFPDPPSYSAYQSPDYAVAAADAAHATKRPGWLTAICVIAIILGVLGVFAMLAGAGGLVFNTMFREQFANRPQAPGMPQGIADAQQKMQEAMYAVADRYFIADVILLPMHGLVSIFLIVAAARAMTLIPETRKLFQWALIAALIMLVAMSLKGLVQQIEMFGVMDQFIKDMAGNMPGQGGQGKDVFVTAMRVGMIIGAVFGFGWQFILCLFYALSLNYLARPNTAALYAGKTTLL
jgi:hypothetical protein